MNSKICKSNNEVVIYLTTLLNFVWSKLPRKQSRGVILFIRFCVHRIFYVNLYLMRRTPLNQSEPFTQTVGKLIHLVFTCHVFKSCFYNIFYLLTQICIRDE